MAGISSFECRVQCQYSLAGVNVRVRESLLGSPMVLTFPIRQKRYVESLQIGVFNISMVIGMAITGSMLCHKNSLKFMQVIQFRVFLSNDQ